VVTPDGVLGCASGNNYAHGDAGGGTTTNYDPDTDGPFMGTPGYGLRRALNTTGDCPYQIPYTITFDGTTAGFVADKLGQDVIVEYVLVTTPYTLLPADNGWPPARR
jgi:hypothetical protein